MRRSLTSHVHGMTAASRGAPSVVAAAALFGTIGTARVLGPDAPAAGVGALRVLLAATLLVVLATPWSAAAGVWRGELRRRPTLVAGTAQAAFQVTFLAAVVVTGVAVGTLVAIGSAPLVAGLLSRRVTRSWLLATVVAVCGLTLLVLGGGGTRISLPGLLLALGAGASYATYTVSTSAAVDQGAEPRVTTAVAFSLAALLLLPGLLVTDLHWAGSPSGLVMVGYLAVVPTVLAYRLFASGLETVPAASASTLGLAEPVVATVLGVVVLDERLGPLGWCGALLVLAGLVLVARGQGARGRARFARVGGSMGE
jgi:DME family drug/metabolite transporter